MRSCGAGSLTRQHGWPRRSERTVDTSQAAAAAPTRRLRGTLSADCIAPHYDRDATWLACMPGSHARREHTAGCRYDSRDSDVAHTTGILWVCRRYSGQSSRRSAALRRKRVSASPFVAGGSGLGSPPSCHRSGPNARPVRRRIVCCPPSLLRAGQFLRRHVGRAAGRRVVSPRAARPPCLSGKGIRGNCWQCTGRTSGIGPGPREVSKF